MVVMNVWEANKRADDLAARNAWLETVADVISGNCKWREVNLCDLDCRGREFCKTEGLNLFKSSQEGSLWPAEGEAVCAG